MKNKAMNKVVAMVIMVVMCITLFSFGTSAVSTDIKGSIVINALTKDTREPVSGAVFRVYRIASAYTSGDDVIFVYTDDFKNNGMDMGNASDAYLPIHLAVYAQALSLPYTEKTTGADGRVVFDNLPCGAYLVVPTDISEGYLKPTPFVVTIPTKDSTQNKWFYDVDATPKVEIDRDETSEKTYISVKKYWKSTEKTPDNITVSLVKDGVVSGTVVLNAANNWYHKWENLDKNHAWSVIETNVPEGYTVSYVASEMTVVITNTDDDYEDETTTSPQDTTSPDDTTTTEGTTDSDDITTTVGTTNPDDITTTVGTTTPDDVTTTVGTSDTDDTTKPVGTTKPTGTTESTTKPEELIKTGQLNWPVPIFSIAGMLLFSVGWVLFNFGKKDEETA